MDRAQPKIQPKTNRVAAAWTVALRIVDRWGAGITEQWTYATGVAATAYLSIKVPLVYERSGMRSILSVILAQVYYTGCQALPLVSILALASGAAVIINASALSFLDGASVVANLMTVVLVRELGPLLIALIVIARSGTAIATELGNMRVNKEIDALETLAINPLSYIVFPRLVGGVVSMICLTFYFDLIALGGGFAVSLLFKDVSFVAYADALSDSLTVSDVVLFLSKTLFNGVSIFAIACFQGLSVNQSSHEVPQAATRSVISSIKAVMITTVLATTVFYWVDLKAVLGS